ncbi:hypothetical protein [Hyphomonas sp.]|uniref:hypothetical protein n=1 Tax=Hyphomonas sp. TaxID=87 RepID=UPI003918DFC2
MKAFHIPAIAAATLVFAACESTGQYQGTTRDATIGGAAGAIGGAVLAGDGNRTQGAVIGGALGAAAGALYGCTRDQVCPWNSNNPNHSQLYADPQTGQRYFIDTTTGDTYWEDGRFRSAGR